MSDIAEMPVPKDYSAPLLSACAGNKMRCFSLVNIEGGNKVWITTWILIYNVYLKIAEKNMF